MTNLTEFQQRLMDAVEALLQNARWDQVRFKAKYDAFRALVERAVDCDGPRKYGEDGIWVRIDD